MDKISDLKKIIIKTLDINKAQDIVSIDLKDKSSMADYMIIASGTSSRHIQSLSEQVLEKLKDNGVKESKIEGKIELEVAYSLLPEHWKKGYATEAAQFCVNYAFKKRLCSSLVSIISTSNEPSIAVAKRIGMQWEQKNIFQQVEAHLYRIRNKHLSK
mgnify:CR=1 FL=1